VRWRYRLTMHRPAHTPYDGTSKLFTIGLKPLDPSAWIEVDGDLLPYLEEKRRLYAEIPDKVFVEEADTREAQREVLDLLKGHLPDRYPGVYRQAGKELEVVGLASERQAVAPLVAASLLVQEDLILMRRGDNGWRLAAGSLCFPSSWVLTEKFGKPLHEIHDPVPGFGGGTRPAELIERMFDRLQGQAVERYNWSIQADDKLYHPLSNIQRIDRATNRPSRFPNADVAAHAFIRVERQTLRKLPVSGDILFTIRIHLDPLRVLGQHPDRASIARSFAAQLLELDEAQLDYKGMTADRDRLVQILGKIASD
jgi:dimethylamine monooxygenase subunit A